MAAGQSQRFYSGVGIFNWYYLSSPPQIPRPPVVHLGTRGLIYALNLTYLYGYCYVYMHACATAKLESQRTAGSKTPGEGAAAAGRTKLLLYSL